MLSREARGALAAPGTPERPSLVAPGTPLISTHHTSPLLAAPFAAPYRPSPHPLTASLTGPLAFPYAQSVCLYLLDECHLALVPGEAFGDGSCLRISYAAAMDSLKEACDRFEKGVAKLK